MALCCPRCSKPGLVEGPGGLAPHPGRGHLLVGIGLEFPGGGIGAGLCVHEPVLQVGDPRQVEGAAPEDVTARLFLRFADGAGNDPLALAACLRRPRRPLTSDELAGLDDHLRPPAMRQPHDAASALKRILPDGSSCPAAAR